MQSFKYFIANLNSMTSIQLSGLESLIGELQGLLDRLSTGEESSVRTQEDAFAELIARAKCENADAFHIGAKALLGGSSIREACASAGTDSFKNWVYNVGSKAKFVGAYTNVGGPAKDIDVATVTDEFSQSEALTMARTYLAKRKADGKGFALDMNAVGWGTYGDEQHLFAVVKNTVGKTWVIGDITGKGVKAYKQNTSMFRKVGDSSQVTVCEHPDGGESVNVFVP
tara:strand:+ start:547 stop:1227 length:681 start_codon:yes stop_codon:yes gene_type:complete